MLTFIKTVSTIMTYHHGNTKKGTMQLASLIHSRRPSQKTYKFHVKWA